MIRLLLSAFLAMLCIVVGGLAYAHGEYAMAAVNAALFLVNAALFWHALLSLRN